MSRQGATVFGVEGLRLTPRERDFFSEAQPWGFILFGRNVDDPEQLSWLTTELRQAVGRAAPIQPRPSLTSTSSPPIDPSPVTCTSACVSAPCASGNC